MKLTRLSLLLLWVPFFAAAQPSKRVEADTLVVADTVSAVRYLKDVPYADRDGVELTLQILRPEPLRGRRLPCVVYVQGSGWHKQNVYTQLGSLSQFAARGYVVAVVEYRPSEVAPFPAQIQDARTAVRFMRHHAARYGVDPDAISIWGGSSGGHTALMMAMTRGVPEMACDTGELAGVSDRVECVVAYFPPTDLTLSQGRDPQSSAGMLLGGTSVDDALDVARRASPCHWVTHARNAGTLPPILLATGDADKVVPARQSVMLAERLEQVDAEYVLYVVPGAGHGSWQFWSTPMFDRVERFLKRY